MANEIEAQVRGKAADIEEELLVGSPEPDDD
jgi:hypothetical protein